MKIITLINPLSTHLIKIKLREIKKVTEKKIIEQFK